MNMKETAGLLALIAAFASAVPARGEQQLPINELDSCEIVLHELIAELRGVRADAKRSAGLYTGEKELVAANQLAVQAWDDAIRLATRKFERCP
jgi:hypothetical protein